MRKNKRCVRFFLGTVAGSVGAVSWQPFSYASDIAEPWLPTGPFVSHSLLGSSSLSSQSSPHGDILSYKSPSLRASIDYGFSVTQSASALSQAPVKSIAASTLSSYSHLPLNTTQDANLLDADGLDEDETILFEADEISRDSEDGPVTAAGNVRAYFGDRYLTAEKLIYYPDTNIVIADGQVSITDANRQTIFAERVELSGDLRDGIAENFSALLDENARVAADSAVREQGARTKLNKVVYTACDVCDDDGEQSTPTWRIKSLRVTRDEERKVIRFRHAFLELKGIPVFYTPFIQAPDPSVERQSGFLTPIIGTSSRLSSFVEVPYYFAVSNNQDFTFFPKFTVSDGTLWQGEWRRAGRDSFHVWAGGVIDFDRPEQCFGTFLFDEDGNCRDAAGLLRDENTGAVIGPSPGDPGIPVDAPGVRWYYFGRGFQNITDNWRIGYDIERVSDDAFLRLYDVRRRGDLRLEFDRSRTNRLRSNINTAWSNGGTSFSADSYLFQGLRATDDSSLTPYVAPLLNLRHDFNWKPAGGDLAVNANFASLQRTGGTDTRRITTQAFWNREHITRGGHRFNAFAELRGDAFFYQDLDEGTEILPNGIDLSTNVTRDPTTDVVGRFSPTAGIEWSYPLSRQVGSARLILEPRVQLAASLDNRNDAEILNEDSQSIEFDYSGLFDYNKSTGFDAVEDGQRLNAGVFGSISWTNGIDLEAAIGQQFRIQDTDAFAFADGLGEERSDIVGELNLRFGNRFALENRFRLDENRLREDGTRSPSFQRIESALRFNVWRLNGNVRYTRLEDENTILGVQSEEEINALARLKLTKNWSVGAAWREDLRPDPIGLFDDVGLPLFDPMGARVTIPGEGTIRQDFLLGYRDECSTFEIVVRRDRTRDVGLVPDTSVIVRFTLRSLTSAGIGEPVRR